MCYFQFAKILLKFYFLVCSSEIRAYNSLLCMFPCLGLIQGNSGLIKCIFKSVEGVFVVIVFFFSCCLFVFVFQGRVSL